MSEVGPDWGLLRRDPARFFGLSEPFDRKDLKRAYNGWVRRYKPERCPEEFQRIRAGYELLIDVLRTGELASGLRLGAYGGVRVPDAGGSDAAEPSASRVEPELPALEALAPALGYAARLKQQPATPRTHLELALLSDLLGQRAETNFIGHLVRGLAESPGSVLLVRTLRAWARESRTEQALRTHLNRWRAELHPLDFARVAPPLLRQLVRRDPEAFAEEYARIPRAENGVWVRAHALITSEVLPAVARWGSADWVAETMAEAWREQADWVEEERFDLCELLLEWRGVRGAFLDVGSPTRRALARCVDALAMDDEGALDREFLRAMSLTRRGPVRFLEEFPQETPGAKELVAILDLISEDVQERVGGGDQELDRGGIISFCKRTDELSGRTVLNASWNLAGLSSLLIWFAIPSFVIAIVAAAFLEIAWQRWLAAGLALAVSAYPLLWIHGRCMGFVSGRASRRAYRDFLRREALAFLWDHPLPVSDFALSCQEEAEKEDYTFIEILAQRVVEDPPLALASIARRYEA